MSRVFFLFIAFLTIGHCAAQQLQVQIDSLLSLLQQHHTPDTIKLNLLNELSYMYYSVDPAKGLEKAEEALQVATKLNHMKGLAIAYSRKGINHWARGEDSLAMAASNRSLHLHKEAGNWLNYAKGLNNRALNHYNSGDYIDAIHDHEEAIAIFTELRDTVGLQHSCLNMGVVFLALDDYPRALGAFLNAQRIAPQKNALQANTLTNIGLVYKNTKDYPKAFDYQQKALEQYRKTGDKQGEANALGNVAALFNLTGEPEKAVAYFQQALAINREIGNDRRIASDLTNIGVVYNSVGQQDKAAGYLQQAITIYAKTNDKNGYSEALLQLANGYTGNDGKKLSLQQQALKVAQENGSPLRQSEALGALSQTYEEIGDFRHAFQTYKRHIALRDSVFGKEKDKAIVRKQMEFDFEKKEALAQAEIKRQVTIRKAFLMGSLILLLAIIVSGLFYKRKRDAESKKRQAEHEVMVAETELKALRAQMNPHFIFNSLNAIADCLSKEDIYSARTYLGKFAKLMRLTLENAAHREISLADDLTFLEMYFQVEESRLQHKFVHEIQVDEQIDVDNVLVPPMLLQPFIENSIWHGISHRDGKGYIHVNIHQQGELLVCSVEDNGVGMQYHAENISDKQRQSFGIRLTEERLAILCRQQPGYNQLYISHGKGGEGVRVDIRLPLKLAF